MQAREQGVLPEGALAQLQSVQATGVLETMAAMDAINGLEPIAAAARARPAAAPDRCGSASARLHTSILDCTQAY